MRFALINTIYCLLSQAGTYSRVVEFSHNAFIKSTINGDWSIRVKEFIKDSKKEDYVEKKCHNIEHLTHQLNSNGEEFQSPIKNTENAFLNPTLFVN